MGNYGFPTPDRSREFCAKDAKISGKFGVPLTLFLDGIGVGCGEIRGSPDALPKWNWWKCREIRGSPNTLPERNWCKRREIWGSLNALPKRNWCKCGEIRGSLNPLPEWNWCKCKEIQGSHVCLEGIHAKSTRSLGIYVWTKLVPSLGDSGSPDIYVRTKFMQLWEIRGSHVCPGPEWRFGVPRYMSGWNSCESRGFGVPPRSILQAWEILPPPLRRRENGWTPFECRNLGFLDPRPNGICASAGVSGFLPHTEFVQLWVGHSLCPDLSGRSAEFGAHWSPSGRNSCMGHSRSCDTDKE